MKKTWMCKGHAWKLKKSISRKEKDMKARIVKDSGGCYTGEVYGTWFNLLLDIEQEGWNSVTGRCMTKLGARIALEKWKREHYPEEFEI